MTETNITTIVILGMHRSGTSMITGVLKYLGVDIGTYLLDANYSNPLGHFENIKFLKLNDKILKRAGGSWCDPPPREKIISLRDEFSEEIKKLLYNERKPVWGWKDPRTVLTIELYLPYLINPYFIICYRNNIDVAKSLLRRDGTRIKKGYELANIYNKRLNDFLNAYVSIKKATFEYESFLKNPVEEIARLIKFLDLKPTEEQINSARIFIADPRKLHHVASLMKNKEEHESYCEASKENKIRVYFSLLKKKITQFIIVFLSYFDLILIKLNILFNSFKP